MADEEKFAIGVVTDWAGSGYNWQEMTRLVKIAYGWRMAGHTAYFSPNVK